MKRLKKPANLEKQIWDAIKWIFENEVVNNSLTFKIGGQEVTICIDVNYNVPLRRSNTMHKKQMDETEGEFDQPKVCSAKCPKCEGVVRYQEWESSCGGYVDYKYKCDECKYYWWVDGSDA